MKQTAVEFLLSKTSKQCFNKREIEQALQMEKQQIIDACNQTEFEDVDGMGIHDTITKGEEYYNETFKTKKMKSKTLQERADKAELDAKKLIRKQIQDIEKKVAQVCDFINDEITGIPYPKKKTEVTRDDNGVIINKETGEPHFSELSSEKKSREIEITFSFGENCASLKWQLNKQGFELSDKFMLKAEQIRYDLHSLRKVGILTNKQLWKSFDKLHQKICKKVIDTQLEEGEKSELIETKYIS
jgi:hypothetical protein